MTEPFVQATIEGNHLETMPSGALLITDAQDGQQVCILAEERRAVALALIGGITDELIERVYRAVADFPVCATAEQDIRIGIREVLEAVFA
jgi:hypothetical protein